MLSFDESLKEGFGRYMAGFHASLYPDTAAVLEFMQRDFSKAVVMVPGRMVDDVEAMLASWRKSNTSGTAQATPFLPLVMIAIAKDYTAASPDWAPRQLGDAQQVMIPGDALERVLDLQTTTREVRAQVVIAAADAPTASSIAMQFHAWCSKLENRRFPASYELAGVLTPWPVVLDTPDIVTISLSPEDQKNITCLAADLVLRPTVPIAKGPRPGEPNDGKGAGTFKDPHGQPVVIGFEATQAGGGRTFIYPEE